MKVGILTVTDFKSKEINTYNVDRDDLPKDVMISKINGCKVCGATYDQVMRNKLEIKA